MPVTKEDVKALTQKLPQDEKFAKAAFTQQLYSAMSEGLGKLVGGVTSNIYGDQKNWDPEAVVGNLENYDMSVHQALSQVDKVLEDNLLGPVYREWLLEKSKNLVTMKNMALPWLKYIKDRASFMSAYLEQQEETIKQQKELAQKELPKLDEIYEKFGKIGTHKSEKKK
jgi:hypothetical protein